jgi:hypothetical protein
LKLSARPDRLPGWIEVSKPGRMSLFNARMFTPIETFEAADIFPISLMAGNFAAI